MLTLNTQGVSHECVLSQKLFFKLFFLRLSLELDHLPELVSCGTRVSNGLFAPELVRFVHNFIMYLQSFFRWFSQYGSLLSALLGWNTLIELFLASLTFVFWSDACEHAGALRTELAYLVAMRGLSRAVAATLVFLFGLVAPTLYLTQGNPFYLLASNPAWGYLTLCFGRSTLSQGPVRPWQGKGCCGRGFVYRNVCPGSRHSLFFGDPESSCGTCPPRPRPPVPILLCLEHSVGLLAALGFSAFFVCCQSLRFLGLQKKTQVGNSKDKNASL